MSHHCVCGISLYSWDRCTDFAAYSYEEIVIILNDGYEPIFVGNTLWQLPLPMATAAHDLLLASQEEQNLGGSASWEHMRWN